jgi:serine/threonine-protein kinase
MSILGGFKLNKAVNTLIDADNPKDAEVINAFARLKAAGDSAVPRLIDGLADAPQHPLIENLLATLLNSKNIDEYIDALTDNDRKLVASIARILVNSNQYDPNRLIKHLDDPDVPKKVLLQILVAKKENLSTRKLVAKLENAEKGQRNMLFQLIQATANEEAIPALSHYLDAEDPNDRIQAVRILSQFNTEAVRSILIRALTDSNKTVRQTALEGISKHSIKVPVHHLCPLLKDPDMTVQARAIEAMIKVNDPGTVQYLIEILNDDSEYVRRAAVEVLNEVADPRAIKNLLNAMRDTDWWVRVRAADALGSIGGPRVVEAVISLLKDEDEFMRRTAVEILNSVKDERAYFYLVQALNDNDWWVRERAADALGQLGDTRAIPELFQAIDHYPESVHVLVQALVKLGDEAIVNQLLQKAHESTGETRKELLLAISECARKEDIEEFQKQQAEASKISGAEYADNPTVQARVPHNVEAPASPSEETSAGVLDLTNSTTGEEIAQVFDATKFSPGYTIANRYKVIKQIGKGAFGVVVLVEDTMVGEQLVLKFLNVHVSSDEHVIERFIHEMRYARKITHENVIRIYDFIAFGRSYAISMEYFDSHSLAFEMKTKKDIDYPRVLKIFCDICRGVGFAHKHDVVHRDLKPANILIGEDDHVKIVDFGLAAAAASPDSRLTRTGILVGTPTYMAPEQVRARTIDARTDIYSLGVLMYELFVGRPPYKGEDHLATLFQHVEGKAVPAHLANPKVPEHLSEVIMKAMALKPDDRYQSADELRLALEEVLKKEAA